MKTVDVERDVRFRRVFEFRSLRLERLLLRLGMRIVAFEQFFPSIPSVILGGEIDESSGRVSDRAGPELDEDL